MSFSLVCSVVKDKAFMQLTNIKYQWAQLFIQPAKFSDRSALVCSVLLLTLCVLEHGMGSNEVKRTFQSIITEEIFVSLTF